MFAFGARGVIDGCGLGVVAGIVLHAARRVGALALAPLLASRRVIAVAVIAALVVLRAGQAATPSLDWGSEWYQNRAGAFLDFMRRDLLRKQPDVAPHTRLFFSHVPSNVGFLTESGPALRVWYGDSTLSGGFVGRYTRRDATQPPGPDLFFRYDSTTGWVRIATGAEDTAQARRVNPRWEADHRQLAAAFARAQAWREAGRSRAPRGGAPEHPRSRRMLPLLCDGRRSLAAARWFEVAARAPGADDDVRRSHASSRVTESPRCIVWSHGLRGRCGPRGTTSEGTRQDRWAR